MSEIKNNIVLEQYGMEYNFLTEKKYTEETGLELPKIKEESENKKKKSKDKKDKQSIGRKSDKKHKDVDNKNTDDTLKDKNEDKKEVIDTVVSSTDALKSVGNVPNIVVESIEKETENIIKNITSSDVKTTIHDIKTVPTSTENKGFISAVGDSMKVKHEREKEELSHMDKNYPYKATNLLTNAEKQLFLFMENNLVLKDRIRIIPKVRLADIIQVEERLCKSKEALWKITSKHVDYIIVDKNTFDLICVVELDDYTHETDEAKKRDELVYYSLLSAGLQLYRIRCRIAEINTNHLRGIEECILMYYRKPCPMCGSDMQVKSKNSGIRAGHRFYSCTDFINCRFTIDID